MVQDHWYLYGFTRDDVCNIHSTWRPSGKTCQISSLRLTAPASWQQYLLFIIYRTITIRFLIFGPVIRFMFRCKCVGQPNLSMKSNAGSVVGSLPFFSHHCYWLGYFASKYCAVNVMIEAICWNGTISRTSKQVFDNNIWTVGLFHAADCKLSWILFGFTFFFMIPLQLTLTDKGLC